MQNSSCFCTSIMDIDRICNSPYESIICSVFYELLSDFLVAKCVFFVDWDWDWELGIGVKDWDWDWELGFLTDWASLLTYHMCMHV
jgi:hypothetical protein